MFRFYAPKAGCVRRDVEAAGRRVDEVSAKSKLASYIGAMDRTIVASRHSRHVVRQAPPAANRRTARQCAAAEAVAASPGHDARHGADADRHAEVPRRPARRRNRQEGLRQPRLRSRRGSLPDGHAGGQCPGHATGLYRRRLPAEPGLRHLRGPGGRPLALPDPEHGRGLYLGDHRRQGRTDGPAGAARRAGHSR